jgi:hypothetical protein
MGTTVTTEFFAKPGQGADVADLLLKILGESLEHKGCETIRIVRRTNAGYTDTFEAMLTQPLVIRYYDELYFGEGIAAGE